MRLSAKLGCSYVSTWQSPWPLTVVEQGRLAIELRDGSGQGASALVVGTAYRAVLRLPAPSLQPTRFGASIAHSYVVGMRPAEALKAPPWQFE